MSWQSIEDLVVAGASAQLEEGITLEQLQEMLAEADTQVRVESSLEVIESFHRTRAMVTAKSAKPTFCT